MDVSFINRPLYVEKYMHLYICRRKYRTDNFIFFLDMLIQLFLGNSYNFTDNLVTKGNIQKIKTSDMYLLK